MANLKERFQNFINSATLKYDQKFDYTQVDYKRNDIKVLIKCNDCNLEFLQTPANHLNFNGCKGCSRNSMKIKMKLSFENLIAKYKAVHRK